MDSIKSRMSEWSITILIAHRDKNDKTQVLPTYEVFSLKLHNQYNTYTYVLARRV